MIDNLCFDSHHFPKWIYKALKITNLSEIGELKRRIIDLLSADNVYLFRKYVYLFRMCLLIQENVYIFRKNPA